MERRSGRSVRVVLLVVALAATTAAAPRPQSPEEKAYRDVLALIDRGDPAAWTMIDRTLAQYGANRSAWIWGVGMLRARQPIASSDWDQAHKILDPEPPAAFAESEPAIKRLILLAWCRWRVNEDPSADLEKARKLAETRQPSMEAEVLQMQASCAKDSAKIGELAGKALSAARKRGQRDLEAKAGATLALALGRQQRYDEAIRASKDALRMAKERGLTGLANQVIGNLAWLYGELGEHDVADQMLAKAAADAVRLNRPSERATWLNLRGNIRRAQRRYGEAAAFYRQALEIVRRTKEVDKIGPYLANLARIALDTGNYPAARQYNEQAKAEKSKAKDRTGELRSLMIDGRIAAAEKKWSEAEESFKKVASQADKPFDIFEAQGRLGVLNAALGKRADAERYFRQALETAEEARTGFRTDEVGLTFNYLVSEFYSAYIDFLVDGGRKVDALRVAEASRARTLAAGLGIPAERNELDEHKIARESNAVILSYWLGPARSHLWVITPQATEHLPLPPEDAVNELAAAYQKELLRPTHVPSPASAGAKLYGMLVAPAAHSIPANARVVIIPDGALNALNMETLIVPAAPARYWISDVTIEIASSLQFVARSRPTDAPQSVLIIGNAQQCDPSFPKLQNAGKEIALIRNDFTRSQTIEGRDATPAAYARADAGSFDVVHFVAHGMANSQQPLESAVVLSCGADGNYKLFARDIMRLPLRARLVTISSCRSAGDRAYSGEGQVGLAWAFLRAGAHQVIAALWDVKDSATPELMDAMYGDIRRGLDPAAALRAAKLRIIHEGGVYRKPRYWAPFVLYSGK